MGYKVYIHTTPSNKVYIGLTQQEPKVRWSYGNNYKYNEHFYRAIKKYGWENIKHEIIKDNLTKEEACLLEQELIKKYNSTNKECGYNVSTGGEAPYGVKFTKERKEKISKANKGRKFTEEHKSKLHQLWEKGHTPWNKGKKTNQETITKIKKAKKQFDILCIETNEKYESLRDAFKNTNINFHHIAEVCKGKRKTAGGYHWKYIGGVE